MIKINQRLLHNIKSLSHNVLDRVLEGSTDRSIIVSILNDFYNHLYINGDINGLCKVSVTSGREEYATVNSALQFRSGIEVKITNPNNITEEEGLALIHIILIGFPKLVRVLISMGFDTLRGKIGEHPDTLDIRLADFVNYSPPMNISHDDKKKRNTNPKVIHQPKIHTPSTKPIAMKTNPIQRKNIEFNGGIYNR